MIYEVIGSTEPIEQGDVFRNIPRVDFSLSSLAIVDKDYELRKTTWRDHLASNPDEPISAVLAVKPVTAIVITQNCDAARGQTLSMCQVDDYLEATSQSSPPKSPKAWQSLLVRISRQNSRFFYLPADSSVGLGAKSAVDFRVVLPVPRVDLEGMREHRIGRLNQIAREHFREALSHFFRRYAYNEWYPLTREEFAAYVDQVGEPIPAFDWQK